MTQPSSPRSYLFVVPRFHTNIFTATKALVEAGHKVTVFATESRDEEDHSIIKPVVFGKRPSWRRVRAELRRADPDLVLLRTARPLSYLVAHMCSFGRRRLIHYNLRPLHLPRKWYEFAEWWVQGLSARRVTPRLGLDLTVPADRLAEYLPWPVERVPGIDHVPRGEGEPLRILCVGKLMQARKGQEMLIGALADHLSAGRVRLTLAGSTGAATGAERAYYEKLKAMAEASGGAIVMLENVPYAEMAGLYARHDICVLPARNEPLGIAPVEAMAYGCVPVVTTGCGCACYIESGENGIVVEQRNPEALKAAMDRLVGDPDLVLRMAAATRATAETELGPARYLERIEAL
jgi:glycosyltransferase involved in cell wall biosynthesis